MMKNACKNTKDFFLVFVRCIKISWRSSPLYTILRIFLKVLAPLFSFISIFMTKKIIDTILLPIPSEQKYRSIVVTLIIIGIAQIANKVLTNIAECLSALHNDMVQAFLTTSLQDISQKADIEMFDNPKYYDAFHVTKRDSYILINTLWQAVDSIGAVVTFAYAFFILCGVTWLMTSLLVLLMIPSVLITQKYTKDLYTWDVKHTTERRKIEYYDRILTTREYAPELRLYHFGNFLIDKYKVLWRDLFKNKKKILKKKAFFTVIVSMLPDAFSVFILGHMIFSAVAQKITIGDYSMYAGFLTQLMSSVSLTVVLFANIYENKLRVENIDALKHFKNKVHNFGQRVLDDKSGFSIEFKNVTFRYPETDKNVLSDVSFTIEDKQHVCLIGVNGSGKSTIVKLLLRFYDVDRGEICVNGYNIKEYDIVDLRRHVSCLFQEFVNYAFTLRENITISNLENVVSDQFIVETLKRARADDIYKKAEDGLDTYITKSFERSGMALSGGQLQKLAIARTFYRSANFLILDEPSASLDTEAESIVFSSFQQLCQGKTALFTSHRLSNVHMADKIVIIEDGYVLGEGPHHDLLKNNSRYRQLYQYQANKFK